MENVFQAVSNFYLVCPNCHRKITLPRYKCPLCGQEYEQLKPSKYGIIFRKCVNANCSKWIPVSVFTGRRRLKAQCSDCSTEITAESIKPICIPILGGSAAGKSTFLIVTSRELIRRILPRYCQDVHFLSTVVEDRFKQMEKTLLSFNSQNKTTDIEVLNIIVKRSCFSQQKLLYLYDIPGDFFNESAKLRQIFLLEHAHGLIFLIDPLSIPEFNKKYSDFYGQDEVQRPFLEDIFDRLIISFEKNFGYKQNKKIEVPISFVINKIDLLDLQSKLGRDAINNLILENPEKYKTEGEAINQLCRELLIELGMSNFLNKVENKFTTYRFFSCISEVRDTRMKAITYEGVVEPLAWVLSTVDRSLRKAIFSDFALRKSLKR